jgi:DNA-binding transcriptional ArsR family regulator
MRPQAVSNQLQRLLDLGVLACRREGNNVRYRVVDRCVAGLLEQGWCLVDQAGRRESLAGRVACEGVEG